MAACELKNTKYKESNVTKIKYFECNKKNRKLSIFLKMGLVFGKKRPALWFKLNVKGKGYNSVVVKDSTIGRTFLVIEFMVCRTHGYLKNWWQHVKTLLLEYLVVI